MAASGSDAEGLHSQYYSMYCISKIQVKLDSRDPRKITEAGIGYGGKAVEVLLGCVSAIELSGRRSFQKAVQ